MIDYNLHQHSLFSDGKSELEDYVKSALELGMSAIGFSEHSPLPFDNNFSLKAERIDEYIRQTDFLKEKYKDKLKIYRALEMDYIPGISTDFDYWRNQCNVDYLIGSIHLVKADDIEKLWFTDGPDYTIYDQGIQDFFGGDVKKAVRQFYHQTNAMIKTQQFEIIGHFDKIKMHNRDRFFSDKDKWYRELIDETIDLIKQKCLIVEINTRGIYKKRSEYLFPDGYALQKIKELNIPIIISSDAHHPDELTMLFSETINKLTTFGFKEVMCFSRGNWVSVNLQ
jgi:histidinol-phosphatase (PHP family)